MGANWTQTTDDRHGYRLKECFFYNRKCEQKKKEKRQNECIAVVPVLVPIEKQSSSEAPSLYTTASELYHLVQEKNQLLTAENSATADDARPFQILMSITGMDYKLKITQTELAVQYKLTDRLKRELLSK